ncbi:hypothetical protein ES703_124262 [subsurface metagenome]
MTESKLWHIGQSKFITDPDHAYYPYFTLLLRSRVKAKKATNIAVTGEAGIGKSQICLQIAQNISPKHRKTRLPKFGVDQIVFTFKEFMEQVLKADIGVPIVFDEPSYAMGKREWYKQINQALVKTIESFRFKVRPLFIPIINISLLDKSVRSQLVQFHVVMNDRGKASVYQISPSQFTDKTYWNYLADLEYPLLDSDKCPKETCLGCRTMDTCPFLRGQYEKKKASIQELRYSQTVVEEAKLESRNLTIEELQALAMKHFDDFYDKTEKSMDVMKMRIILRREEKVHVSRVRAYEVRKLLQMDHPDWFDKK